MHANTYHRKLYQYIVDEIGQRIIRGEYRAEEVLPTEDQLSTELRVSRGVLREAIKVLTQKGLIQTRPRVGTQILPRENWNLFDPDVLVWRLQIENHLFEKCHRSAPTHRIRGRPPGCPQGHEV